MGTPLAVGITDLHRANLVISFCRYSDRGEFVKDEIFGAVEVVKTVADLLMPFQERFEVNPELEDAPELVNSDPYAGWMIKIVFRRFEIDTLLLLSV